MSQITVRWLESARVLAECPTHRLRAAGNAGLMTPALIQTLCEHALAAQRDLAQLDDKLYLEVCAQAEAAPRRAASGRRR